jgi:diaminopimelate decarboxylase
MTIARVVYRKYDSRGDLLIGLEMNRTQLFSSSADFLLDPSLLYQQAPDHHDREVSAYFVGASCLEQDVILKRKIRLEKVPDIGDLVCFPNTAGYLMHFYETETHLFELAKNLILEYQQDGGLSFREDEDLL